MIDIAVLSVEIDQEQDVVLARQRARQIAALLSFEPQDQTRIATAVSEVARNAHRYAGGGRVEFRVEGAPPSQTLTVRISDTGPGIPNLSDVLDGRTRSSTGAGRGLVGARRLMDGFEIRSSPRGGTTVTLSKALPARAPAVTQGLVSRLVDSISKVLPGDAAAELVLQNQELLRTMDELRSRQDDLLRVNRELEDTNRGVIALYSELDEKAEHLRRADAMKSRFLSHMSHEFRTPINSILALSGLLLARMDGDLTPEQEKQVTYVRRSADTLLELINDLLDLAKIEAGKVDVRPSEFTAANLFSALRGMFRPLLVNPRVELVFEDVSGLPVLDTDEAKVAQILRNLISNALKFTEEGEVRVSATHHPHQGSVEFQVADTGIGIAPEDRDRIFQEFSQIDNPMQRRHKGTGLGLPLSRRLAELLGGEVWVTGRTGGGSIFSALIPVVAKSVRDRGDEDVARSEAKRSDAPRASSPRTRPQALPDRAGSVLVIDDEDASHYVMERMLAGTPFRVLRAMDGAEGLKMAAAERPRAILLDLRMPGMSGEEVLDRLECDPEIRGIPVLIVSSRVLSDLERDRLAPRVAAIVAKNDLASESGRRKIFDVLEQLEAAPSSELQEARDGKSVDHSQR